MFSRHITLKKFLTITLSVCLLGMFLGCVTVCVEHLEDPATADVPGMSEPCTDDDCLVKASTSSVLPERSYLLPEFDDSLSQPQPVYHVEFMLAGSTQRLRFFTTFAPPPERFSILRI